VVIVENAGVPEVNGEYHFDRVLYNADSYSRKGNYLGKEVNFGIWAYQGEWRIAKYGKNMADPAKDPTWVPFYSAHNSPESKLPSSWVTYRSSYKPSPQVSVVKRFQVSVSSAETLNSLLLENDGFKDFRIVYQNAEFKAHKCVLAASSLYFQRMFSNEWKEKNFCEIAQLEYVTVEDFKVFVEFLYLQSFKSLSSNHVWSVWNICDYLEVLPSIKEKVIQMMVVSLNCQNVAKLLRIVNALTVTTFSPNILQETFAWFVTENSNQLAVEEFPFHEIDRRYCNSFSFKSIKVRNSISDLAECCKKFHQ
jgi:hypothetical protein